MSATDFVIESPLPQITAVSAHDGFVVNVTWADGRSEMVDLAPAIFRYKVYAPLRSDPQRFAAMRPADQGHAIEWGDDIDMAATVIEDLAGQSMKAADFAAFMKRRGYTLDAVAAELGISRRLAAYYQSGRPIPRYIGFACLFLDLEADAGARAAVPKALDVDHFRRPTVHG